MKKLLVFTLISACFLCLAGCSASNAIPAEADITEKAYVYEKEGCGSDFTIEIRKDGTFSYYEGVYSSHLGMGEWTYADGTLTLIETMPEYNEATGKFEDSTWSHSFSVGEDVLIFAEDRSDNFLYVKVKDGEKFHAVQEEDN